jgi:hypothetical protein
MKGRGRVDIHLDDYEAHHSEQEDLYLWEKEGVFGSSE